MSVDIIKEVTDYDRKSDIIREKLDYTKWQQIYYDAMKPGEFHEKALEYAKLHPYTGKVKNI